MALSAAGWLLYFVLYWPYRGRFDAEGRYFDALSGTVHHAQAGELAFPATALLVAGLVLCRVWWSGRAAQTVAEPFPAPTRTAPFRALKVVWNDWPALAAAIAVPMAWIIHAGFAFLQRHAAPMPWWFPVGMSLAMAAVLVWRIARVRWFFVHGASVVGVVTELRIVKDRGRLAFQFDLGPRRVHAWMPIHRTRAVLALAPGDPVEVLYDPRQPARALVRQLFAGGHNAPSPAAVAADSPPMQRALLVVSHLVVLAIGFALGVYALPILTAPDAPSAQEIQSLQGPSQWTARFRRDLKDSDALHWGEGTVSVGPQSISLVGKLAPGPNYKLYLAPQFVETEADFLRLKPQMVQVGDVRTFENFLVPVPPGIDPSRFNTVVIWCEAFSQFITAARYQ
jgi:hypothetical protein